MSFECIGQLLKQQRYQHSTLNQLYCAIVVEDEDKPEQQKKERRPRRVRLL